MSLLKEGKGVCVHLNTVTIGLSFICFLDFYTPGKILNRRDSGTYTGNLRGRHFDRNIVDEVSCECF